MLTTAFTRLVGCTVPIQQAGMGGVATPELAVAAAADKCRVVEFFYDEPDGSLIEIVHAGATCGPPRAMR